VSIAAVLVFGQLGVGWPLHEKEGTGRSLRTTAATVRTPPLGSYLGFVVVVVVVVVVIVQRH